MHSLITIPKEKTNMKKIILSTLAIAAFAYSQAQTTTASASQTVTLNLQNQITIGVVNGTATGTAFTFANTANYASGLTNTAASQFQVQSNRPWAVTVASSTASFSSSAATVMPSSVLGVRLNGQTTAFTPMSTTAAAFTNGSRGSSNFTVDYNANPGFAYDAGTYTLSVVYTATQQ